MKLLLSLLLTGICFGADNVAPFAVANVEAAGIFFTDVKEGANYGLCVRIFRPCESDSTKTMGLGAGCNNDEPYSVAEIHEDAAACAIRPANSQDSIFLHALIQMPDAWWNKLKTTKNYYQSDSAKVVENWKVVLSGLSDQDKAKLKIKGPVSGMLSSAVYFEGKKCAVCN